ncbi:unnamed protein product [Didymodactylos carnosus]|uniref:N-acetyltransferase domain-containing protein n=1 Tax=Didymodactylos carnosus TaxID=1234261 RepID=A0A8S2ETR0_9BILA|nr:unnamed protein product [Didymodactylos carnosus]CAF4043615.1 unnamed protein product [Didymodactylos carnosus]
MKLQFSKYHSRFLKSCAQLVQEIWPLEDDLVHASQPHHLFYYYVRNCVDNSTYTDLIVDEENDERILGILVGDHESHRSCRSMIKNFRNCVILYKHILCSHLGKRFVALEVVDEMSTISKRIEDECEEFDSEINLLVLSKDLQGKGYGRLLMERYIEFCKNDKNIKSIFVWSDISCNYKFYEHYGFRLYKQFYDDRLTAHDDNREDKPNAFIYYKILT